MLGTFFITVFADGALEVEGGVQVAAEKKTIQVCVIAYLKIMKYHIYVLYYIILYMYLCVVGDGWFEES